MDEPGTELRCHHLVHRESGVLQHGPVRVEEGSVRPPDDDELGYGVDDAPQLPLVLPQLRFGLLEVFDIGVGSVPPDDIASFIAQRLDPDEEPTILTVVTPMSYFELTRLPCRKNLMQALGHRARGIVGMICGFGKVVSGRCSPRLALPTAIHFFPRETGVLMPALIEVGDAAIRAKAPRLGGDRVEDRLQTVFRVLRFDDRFLESRPCPDADAILF